MSYRDYQTSKVLDDVPFYALIMAAMRKADTDNKEKLEREWPETYRELVERYNDPGGKLRDER